MHGSTGGRTSRPGGKMFTLVFPKLHSYDKTSEATPIYNCIAWAFGDNTKWWWPDPSPLAVSYWPDGYLCDGTVASFDELLTSVGGEVVASPAFESGFEKIALFSKDGEPTHACRLLSEGRWTSKMGNQIDIAHALADMEGGMYGDVLRIYRIPRPAENATG